MALPGQHVPVPIMPGETCEDVAAFCRQAGMVAGGCDPSFGWGHCIPEPKSKGAPWSPLGLAVVGAILGGVAIWAYYSDPGR